MLCNSFLRDSIAVHDEVLGVSSSSSTAIQLGVEDIMCPVFAWMAGRVAKLEVITLKVTQGVFGDDDLNVVCSAVQDQPNS